ncbi:MAG: SulP family inorganic anion transporter [Elainellaceae cyanobacterium]
MKLSSSDLQPHRLALVTYLRQELQPSRLVPTLTAGIITGVLLVIYAISMAALIFTGSLAEFVPIGIGLGLFTAIVAAIIVALTNSLPGIVIMPQDSPAVILAIIASAIASQMSASDPALLPTVIMALAVTTGVVGIVYFLLGTFKLGNLIRFIPYPVVGGFLAGTGYLLAQGAFNVMADQFFGLGNLPALLAPTMLVRWLPGCGVGIALVVLLRRYNSVFVMPSIIVGSTVAFYLILWFTQTPLAEAKSMGLLFGSFPEGGLWRPLHWSMLTQVHWSLILSQAGNIATTVLLSVIALLLNASGIELAVRQDLDLNRELRASGLANMAVGLGGGIVSFHALGLSILSCAKINAKSRLVGVLAAFVCLITLLLGETLVTLFPKLVLGGVALFLGLSFLMEWVYDAWFKLSKTDYGIVILILWVIATVGFLEGVGVGLVVAIALFVVSASRVNVTKHTLSGATHQSHTARSLPQTRILQEEGEQIYILDLQGFLFFGTANSLLNRIQDRLNNDSLLPLKYVVLDFQAVNGLDSSAVLSFVKLKQLLQQQDIKLVLTHLSPNIRTQLKRGGCLLPDDPVCQAFSDRDHGLEWCENALLGVIPMRRARTLPLLIQLNDLFPDRDVAAEFIDYLEEWDAEPGEYVYQHGQPADAINLIEVGEVTVYLDGQQGQEAHRIQALGAGNVVGAVDFFRHSTHQTTAVVEIPSTLYRLSTKSFQRMEKEQPEIATAFQGAVIKIVGDRLTYAYKEIADLMRS